MRSLTLTILTTAAVAAGAAAQELTVEQAVATALEQNPSVQAALARANAAASRHRQARGHRYPKLDLSEIYSRTDNPAEVFAFTLNQERFSFDEFVMIDPNRPEPLDTWITRIELELPIYTGGQLGTRVTQAGLMAEAEQHRSYHTRAQVAFDTITCYVNLAKAREHLALITTARDATARHLQLAQSYAEQGLILDAEVLKARVYLAEMDELLTQADNGARLAEAALNFQLGAPQATPRTLAPLDPPLPDTGDIEGWESAALERRHDLAAARLQLEAGRLEEKTARSSYLPEVGAMGRYELYDDTAFGDNGSSGSVMAFARINLYRGGSDSARQESARYDTASFEADMRRFEEGARLEVRQAWQDLGTARARLTTAAGSLAAAREALRVREQRFQQGLDKMIDLLDAEITLREAEMRELVARHDVALTTYRLTFVSGGNLTESMEEHS